MNNGFNPAALFQQFGGQQQFMNQYNNFVNGFNNQMNPQAKVQEMLNNGSMSQDQFNMLRQATNQIMGTNY